MKEMVEEEKEVEEENSSARFQSVSQSGFPRRQSSPRAP